MNKLFKKIAVVVAMAMVFAAMPMSVFAAADTMPQANDGVIILTDDVVLDSTYYVDGTLTIDLAGHKISNDGGTFSHLICVDAGESLTIKDSVGGGYIVRNNAGGSYTTVISNEQGTVTIEGGTIEINGNATLMYAIDNRTNCDGDSGNATLYINGGTIKSAKYAVRTFANAWDYSSDACVVEFNDGTIESTSGFYVQNAANDSAAKLNIKGGTINTSRYYIYVWDATTTSALTNTSIDVSNGNISGELGMTIGSNVDLDYEISGGTFTTAPAEEYIAAGKVYDPATGVVGDPVSAAVPESTTHEHYWGYNTQYDAAAHWDYCHVCGAQNTAVAHSDANGDGICECGWILANTPSRVNPNTGVTAEMLGK